MVFVLHDAGFLFETEPPIDPLDGGELSTHDGVKSHHLWEPGTSENTKSIEFLYYTVCLFYNYSPIK